MQKDIARLAPAAIASRRHQLAIIRQRLQDASPEKMLARGYSLTLKDGKVVKDASILHPGDVIETVLGKGRVKAEVR
jgi:exodeoxyribonuclease VII large subunit